MKKILLSLLLAFSAVFAWDSEVLAKIDKADDLKIAPIRANGVTGTPTWIWEVVVDGRLFVRPYNGVNSSWYKSAIAYKTGIIVAAGKTYEVDFAPATNSKLNDKIDQAYRTKYSKSPYMRHMISSKCRETTIEIIQKEQK